MKSEKEAYLTLAALCAQAEHCQYTGPRDATTGKGTLCR